MKCDDCGEAIKGYARRGLCMRCYGRRHWRKRHKGTKFDVERRRWVGTELAKERRVLELRGLTDLEIAATLKISKGTVQRNRREHDECSVRLGRRRGPYGARVLR